MAIRDITDDSVYTTINSANFANSEDDEDGNILTDSARDLGVGLVDLGGAAAGAADLVASPFRDKGDSTFTQAWNESAAGDWKRELQEGYSQARKDAEREYEEYMARGDGSTMDQFGRAVFGLATNPRAAIGRVFQSAPAMLAGGGVGGAVGKAALARGATTNAAKWAGRVGSGAAEGGISAGQVAGSIAEYNRENNLDPTQGMAAPVVTALGVGAIGTAGGGMEAGLFNKSLRETAKQSGVGAIPKTFAKEGFKEGAEEAAQAPFETVPENVATGKQWDEGLGRNMGEGFATGFGLGGALGTATKKNLLGDANEETTAKPYTRDVPPQEKEPVDVEGTGVKFQPTGDVEADAQRLVDEDTDVDDEGDVDSEVVEPTEEVAPTPQEEVAPGQPVEPAKSSIDEGGFRDLFDKIHAPDKAVPKAQLKKVNDLFGSSPYGVDVVNAVVSARKEVGSPMNVDGLLNIAQDAVRKSGSIEDAVEYLRDRATWYEENAKGKQDGIVKSDLCAVAAEYLAGNSDTMKFLEERRTARISAEAVAQADAVKQKELDAKAAEKVEGEVVEGDAQSRDEAMQARYRAQKNGGKAPEAPAGAPTVAPTPEDITDVEAKPVEAPSPTRNLSDALSPAKEGATFGTAINEIGEALGIKTGDVGSLGTDKGMLAELEEAKAELRSNPRGEEVLSAVANAAKKSGLEAWPLHILKQTAGLLHRNDYEAYAYGLEQQAADHEGGKYTETPESAKSNAAYLRELANIARSLGGNSKPTAPKAEAPEEKAPIDYDAKAPWVKPKKYESGPIGIREGVVVDPAKRAQEEAAKREARAKAQTEQPAAPQTAPEATVATGETKPVKAKKAKKPKEAIPNPSGQGSLFTEDELPMDAPPKEAPKAEAPKEEPKKVQAAIKPRKEHKSYGTVDDEPIQLASRRRSAPTLDQTAEYDNAFEDYKAKFRARPNGDTASVEDHDAALDAILSTAPKGKYHASMLAGLAVRAHNLSSKGIVTRFKTLLAISKRAQQLDPHERKRVMDNVVSEARMMKMSEEHIEVLKDPSKYKDEPKGEAKATFTPPPLGDGKISDSDMGQLAALKASLSPSKEEPKPVASIPTAETRAEEIETGKPVPTVAEPKGEVAPVAKEEKPEAPKSTAVGPAAKIEAISDKEAPWNPNKSNPISKMKAPSNVYKSSEEALAGKPKSMPKWAQATYDFVVNEFYQEEKRWPIQEEYRDRIWPFLSKEEGFLPDNADEIQSGRAWNNKYFGKITLGNRQDPPKGTKEKLNSDKARRKELGVAVSNKLKAEWDKLIADGKVPEGSKPGIHDARAFIDREYANGNIDMKITAANLTEGVYEKAQEGKRAPAKSTSVFYGEAREAQKALEAKQEAARINPEATKAIGNSTASATSGGTVASTKNATPATSAQLPVPKTSAGASLIKSFPSMPKATNADKANEVGKAIKSLSKDMDKQAFANLLTDLLSDMGSYPQRGDKVTRLSVMHAVVSHLLTNTQRPAKSNKRFSKAQFNQVIKALSDVLHGNKVYFTAEDSEEFANMMKSVVNNTSFSDDEQSRIKEDVDHKLEDALTDNDQVLTDDDLIDDMVTIAESGDDISALGTGGINVESGRTGDNKVRKAKRALEKVARELNWITAAHKSGDDVPFDEHFEGTYETIKERYQDASEEERQHVVQAIVTWGEKLNISKLKYEDAVEVASFVATVDELVQSNETTSLLSDVSMQMYAMMPKPPAPSDEKKTKKKAKSKSSESKAKGAGGVSAIDTTAGLKPSNKSVETTTKAGYEDRIAEALRNKTGKTPAGKRLAKAIKFVHLINRNGRGAHSAGFMLRISDILREATSADDLAGVYTADFAKSLWTAIQVLKEQGITDLPGVYVADTLYSDDTNRLCPGINAFATFGTGNTTTLQAGDVFQVFEDGEWKNMELAGDAAFITAYFPKVKKRGLTEKFATTFNNNVLLHELVHSIDLVVGKEGSNELSDAFKPEVAQGSPLRIFSKGIEPVYDAVRALFPSKDEHILALVEKANIEGVSSEDVVVGVSAFGYPFSYNSEGNAKRELYADAISNYLSNPSFKRLVKAVAPEFAKKLEKVIKNDIKNRGQAGVSSKGTVDSRGSQLPKDHSKGSDGSSTVRSGAPKGEAVDSLRDRGDSEQHRTIADENGGQGTSRGAERTTEHARVAGDTDPKGNANSVSGRAGNLSSEMDGRTSPESDSSIDVQHLDIGGGSRRGNGGGDRVRGDTSVEPGNRARQDKGRTSEAPSGGDNGGVKGETQDQSRFYDIHHKNKELTISEQVYTAVLNAYASAKNKGFLGLLFTRDLVNRATKAAPDVPAFKQWHELLERQSAFRNDWQADVAGIKNSFDSIKDKGTRDAVNEFLELTTLDGVWAYRDPVAFPTKEDWDKYVKGLKGEKHDTYAVLSKRFESLPKEAQDVIKDVLSHGIKARITRANMMRDFNNDRFNAMEALASSQQEKDAIKKERDDWNKKCDSLAKQHRIPYVPLRRFGDHVVVVKSKEYEYTERLASEVYRMLQKKYNGKPTAKQMSPYNKIRSKLVEMQADEAHYVVQFVQGAGSAKLRAKQLEARYPGSIVEHFARAEHVSSSVPSWQKLEQVISSAVEAMKAENIVADAGSNRNTQAALTELANAAQRMYIEALNDDNARKSELRRMKVSGYHTNMMENFAEAGRAEANLYANMSYGAKVRKVLADMQEEVRHSSHRAEAADYQNEVLRRHNQMLSGGETGRATNALLRTNSFVMLLTSPMYYVQNLMQPMMMSAPYMAGNHGMVASATALNSAMAQAAKALRKGTTIDSIADGMGLNDEERAALIRARDLGHIDIGMSSDFGHITHTDATKTEKAIAKVTDKITEISRRVEMVNRIGTFIAAYRLERRRLGRNGKGGAEAAWQYADEVVYKTHGDYSGVNAPRLFGANAFTKIATQFRKFQLIQVGLMFGLAKRAFYDTTPAEKAIARRQLAWTMGIHFAMAGVKGTPFIGTMLALMGFVFGGGDDDDDMIRDYIKDKETSDLLLNGIPKWLGFDMSQKVGAGNMLSPFPFLDTKPQEGKEFWQDLVVAAMGPSGSLGDRAFRALQYGYQGEYYKGVETMAPTGVANVMKAFRFGTEGVTTKAGDVHIPGEDFTLGDLVAQAAGLPPNKITDRTRVMGSLIRHEKWYDEKQDQINRDFKQAFKERDRRAMMEARKRHRELNERRREEGFKIVPMSRLTKTATDQRKREFKGQAIGSTVGVKPSNRRFIQDQLKK